jgi:hypothetical protein
MKEKFISLSPYILVIVTAIVASTNGFIPGTG